MIVQDLEESYLSLSIGIESHVFGQIKKVTKRNCRKRVTFVTFLLKRNIKHLK